NGKTPESTLEGTCTARAPGPAPSPVRASPVAGRDTRDNLQDIVCGENSPRRASVRNTRDDGVYEACGPRWEEESNVEQEEGTVLPEKQQLEQEGVEERVESDGYDDGIETDCEVLLEAEDQTSDTQIEEVHDNRDDAADQQKVGDCEDTRGIAARGDVLAPSAYLETASKAGLDAEPGEHGQEGEVMEPEKDV
ncbi:unnamed protein product, partial [Sphacelaria rigidula]